MAKSSVIFDAYYLISSESPSVEDLTGCLLTIEYNDGEKDIITLTSDNITQPASNVIDVADGMVVVTSAENITYGSNTFPSIGTYFRRRENKRASSIFKGTLEKLNSKFIDTDSLPKETLKITVTLDKAISTVNSLIYHSDKTSDNIKICLDHGGIPYVEFHFYTTDSAAANDYELLTYSGYSNTLGYMFTNAENGNLLCINGHTVSVYSSTAKTELDSTVKTTEQTLTDEQKAQARTNIGAGTQYILPEASSSEFGGIKADDVTETDTQAVRKGADGKLYTAAAVPQVQSDYTQNDNASSDYIKNRPFYEYTAVDITWDGDTTGKTEVDLTSFIGINVYLVSDATPSVEDLNGSTLTIHNGSSSEEQSLTLSAQAASENVIVAGVGVGGYVFVVLADNSEIEGITFPSKGTYLASADGDYVSRIIKEGINKIDPKFIPNGIDTLKVTVTYNSSTDTYSADKTEDDIKTCLDNCGIPYVYYSGDVYTLVGNWEGGYYFRRWTGEYIYINSAKVGILSDNLYEYTNNKVTTIGDLASDDQYPSALAVKKALNNTVKTTEQTLTDEQKTQARTNIGAGVPQVQSDYTQNDNASSDYIKNRPFYEYTAVDITWNGDTTGKTEVDLTSALGFNVYLVSDATPSAEDLIGATLSIYTGSDTMEATLSSEYVQTVSDNIILLAEGNAFVILTDNSEYNGITFPSKGIYFLNSDGAYVSGLTKKIVNKIDKKFIPNGIDTLKITVTYNSSTDTYSNADKSSVDIESCLNNGGIPYIALYGLSSISSSDYIILTYVGGYGGEPKLHVFANEEEGISLNISGWSVSSELYSQSLKGRIDYLIDNTVKTVSQVLTDEQKTQARTNIGATDISLGLTGASAGQIIRIKSVDESGMPTEWEAADSYHAILKTWTAADLEETT